MINGLKGMVAYLIGRTLVVCAKWCAGLSKNTVCLIPFFEPEQPEK